jgi:CRISPR-associated protein Cmr3
MNQTIIIEPRDPIIARDGRPFTADPGARARSLPFVMPSTTTGGVRTQLGFAQGDLPLPNPNDQQQAKAVADKLKRIQVRGPLLAEIKTNATEESKSEYLEFFAPAPADALLLGIENAQHQTEKKLYQLKPVSANGILCDLQHAKPEHLQDHHLELVGLPKIDSKAKPESMPRHWHWTVFSQWLLEPEALIQSIQSSDLPNLLGHNGPTSETRTHVSIDPITKTARDGALFQTSGLEFIHSQTGTLLNPKRLAMILSVNDQQLNEDQLANTLAPLGGERQLMHWCKSDQLLPERPENLATTIAKDGHCRLILLTPAFFEHGLIPTWLLEERHGVTPKLKAIANARNVTISGWNVSLRQAKPTRRLAPAGSVYFLELQGTAQAREAWVQNTWMQNISDNATTDSNHANFEACKAQYRHDGFGLAALGVWTGALETVKP